jgi:hypothetical protein
MSKRIAYFDYNLDNFHANTYLELARKQLSSRGFEISVCRGLIEDAGREWAKKNGVRYAESMQDLADSADYMMVLAPSNPEVHLQMAEQILPFGKTTYIDKTFAPDLETAKKIFAIADSFKTPVMTSSALRYTSELMGVLAESGRESVRHLQAWGGGSSFGEYSIHVVEMIVATMGAEIAEVMRLGNEDYSQIDFRFTDGRSATGYVYIATDCPFLSVVTTDKVVKYMSIDSPIFENLLSAIMDFFEKGEPIDRRESLTIRRILDLTSNSANLNKWVQVGPV